MIETKNILKKFLSYSIGSYLAIIIGFFSTPVVTRLFLPSEFGKFSLILVFVNLFFIGSLMGLDFTYQRYYCEINITEKFSLLRKCLKFSLLSFFIIVGICFILKEIILKYFQIESISVMIVVFILIFITIINRFFGITLIMQQKTKIYSILQVMAQILNIIILLSLYYFNGGTYLILLYSNIIIVFFTTAFYIYFSRNIFLEKKNTIKIKDKDLLKYGIPMAFTTGLTWLFQSIDKIFLSCYSNDQELGYYSAAFKIVSVLIVLQASISTFWNSIAYDIYIKNSKERKFFEKNAIYISCLMFFISIFLLILKPLIYIFLGSKYQNSIDIFPFLLLIPVMQSISDITGIGINFSKKTIYSTIISLIVASINVLGNYLLVPIFGALGAAISSGISYIIFFILRTSISSKMIGFRFNYLKLGFGIIVLIINFIISIFIKNYIINFAFNIISIFILIFIYSDVLNEGILKIKEILKGSEVK